LAARLSWIFMTFAWHWDIKPQSYNLAGSTFHVYRSTFSDFPPSPVN
jgi:hypothetical protein